MPELLIILEAAVMAATYSILVYSRRYSIDHENFNPYKFTATVGIGIAVGIGMALAGDDVTQAALLARLTALAGTIVLVENVLKLAWKNATEAQR